MRQIILFYQSSIGKKYVVAITGVMLFLFVVGHVTGNFKTFFGYGENGIHHLDEYAHFLRTILSKVFGEAGFLWLARIGLIFALILHVATVIQLQAMNRKARPIKYKGANYHYSSFAARSMMIGGIVILIFVILHILHLTVGTIHPNFEEGKVYSNVYYAFSKPWVSGLYTLAMVFLGMHLYHGLWSLFQTLGLDTPDWNSTLLLVAKVLAVGIAVGFVVVPLSITFGFLPAPS